MKRAVAPRAGDDEVRARRCAHELLGRVAGDEVGLHVEAGSELAGDPAQLDERTVPDPSRGRGALRIDREDGIDDLRRLDDLHDAQRGAVPARDLLGRGQDAQRLGRPVIGTGDDVDRPLRMPAVVARRDHHGAGRRLEQMLAGASGHDAPQAPGVAGAHHDGRRPHLGPDLGQRVGRVTIGDRERLASDLPAQPRERRLRLRAQRAAVGRAALAAHERIGRIGADEQQGVPASGEPSRQSERVEGALRFLHTYDDAAHA